MGQPEPELTARKVITLLCTAALIVVLFATRNCSRKDVQDTAPTQTEMAELVISPYDSLFKEMADTVLDWKLLAAIACVESGFDTALVSPVGAFGLMQVMPSTYFGMLDKCGVSDSDSVCSTRLNVMAAARHLMDMEELFGFINEKERLNYVLAGYNCGAGHVFDAMRIARTHGIDRYHWDSVANIMSQMGEGELYSDSICELGPFGGTETIQYVGKVRRKYNQYCQEDSLLHVADSTAAVIPGA